MTKSIIPRGAIRFCLAIMTILLFFTVLFLVGLAIYADVSDMTFEQAWNFIWNIAKSSATASNIAHLTNIW